MTQTTPQRQNKKAFIHQIVPEILLVLLLLAAAVLRFSGIDWGEGQFLHPDEGFLTTVESRLVPVQSLGEYWDTANSTLNPHNSGYTFFVYGTLPIFLVRYVATWLGQTGWGDLMVVGRNISALADLGVIFLVYLTAVRLFDRRVGLFAAAFAAFSVLPIQLSHYFAVDTFLAAFTMLSIYFAVCLATDQPAEGKYFRPRYFVYFGLALGMAVATKINIVPVALVLPLAVWVRISKLERKDWGEAAWVASGYLLLAAFVSVLTFRIFQPYAFTGPGFFGILPNRMWLDSISDLLNQVSGDFDWPPSIQWARRPIWYSFQHMVLWGMGLPMGILAWFGFLWAGWQMLRGRWRQHLILWAWTALYFGWQSMAFNPTMRYQIPVYPTLAIFAAWAVIALWDAAGGAGRWRTWLRTGAALVGSIALVLTAVYAVAFIDIYNQPITRVEASRWIYQNIPGPLNVLIENQNGTYQQPLPFPYEYTVSDSLPYVNSFMPQQAGSLNRVTYKNVFVPAAEYNVYLILSEAGGLQIPIATSEQTLQVENLVASELVFNLEQNPVLLEGHEYLLQMLVLSPGADLLLDNSYMLFSFAAGEQPLPIELDGETVISADLPLEYTFTPDETSTLTEIFLSFKPAAAEIPPSQTLQLSLSTSPDFSAPLAVSQITIDLADGVDDEGGVFDLSQTVELAEGMLYYLQLENLTPGGKIRLSGTAIANEGQWDLGLPLSVDGYSGYNGTYPTGLEMNMYENGSPAKLARFLEILDTSEILTISSSRQWGSTPRIPERYPLNVVYYRLLLGCPEERTIEWCYNVAEPGMFEGQLGFELVRTFQSNPTLGKFELNDQPADEAFTVYDHPKVFIFQKTEDYDQSRVTSLLGAVDFDKVIHLTPKQAGDFKSLLLSPQAQQRQAEGGTWSELFNSDAWYNRSGIGAVLVWYLSLSVLGWAVFPLVRRALPGLPDAGFPLARTAAMLLLSYFSWLAGSLGLSYSRLVIVIVFLLLAAAGLWQGYLQRDWIKETLKTRWRQWLVAELVFLGAFLLVVLVRFGNPDLWHPFKGGEKPMDFAYFNAILKSVAFPAYDPWYAGGYINYYYFGFVFVGTLVKMLGIVPALAYNIVLPTVFAMLAAGAYSIAWNLYATWLAQQEGEQAKGGLPLWGVGVSGALLTGLLGNLGTVQMFFEGLQRLAAGDQYTYYVSIITKLRWTFQGLSAMMSGAGWIFGGASWYWEPSRVIPAIGEPEPITEFPWFTTIYADLHAHFMALALVFLALAWALSVVFSKAWKNTGRWQLVWSFVFAGLAIGSLRPTNTWDLPTYLALGVVAVLYAVFKYIQFPAKPGDAFSPWVKKFAWALGAVIALVSLTISLYYPYAHWYGLPYSQVSLWQGSHTPINSFFAQWGLFMFVITFWMGWETRQWMAATPLSSLRKLEKVRPLIIGALVFLFLLAVILAFGLNVRIHMVALPLAVWAAVLLLRPGISDSKRAVLFMVGTAMFLTILVEVIVLSGDIGRMNTVFKFYLQAWVLLAASSAAALAWTLPAARKWSYGWNSAWRLGVALLVLGAALFPLTATVSKIRDRMSVAAPHTLDGMAFMQSSEYPDEGGIVELDQDYQAIRWMQENVTGTPVILEANTPLYRWGSRFSIYTGLPTVLGWDWHQTQQRGFSQVSQISTRQQAIQMFYLSPDRLFASQFIRDYQVEYIIVGQLERNYFPGVGLDKFEQFNGDLWQEVYRNEQTVIYQVID